MSHHDNQQQLPNQANNDPKPWVRHDLVAVDEYLSNRLSENDLDQLFSCTPSSSVPAPPLDIDRHAPPSTDQKRAFVHETLDWLLGEAGSKHPDLARDPPALRIPWLSMLPCDGLLAISSGFGDIFRNVFGRMTSGNRRIEATAVLGNAAAIRYVRMLAVPDLGLVRSFSGQPAASEAGAVAPQPGRLFAHSDPQSDQVVGLFVGFDETPSSTSGGEPVRWGPRDQTSASPAVRVLDSDFFDAEEFVQLVQIGSGVGASASLAVGSPSLIYLGADARSQLVMLSTSDITAQRGTQVRDPLG